MENKIGPEIVFSLSRINQKDKLQTLLNQGYTVKYTMPKGDGYLFILSKPEIRLEIQEKAGIADFRLLTVKGNNNYIKETKALQKQGFEIEYVTATSALFYKYKKTEAKKQ